MSFNGSFGEGEFVDEENSNILLGQEDIKVNFDSEGINQKYSNTKLTNNEDYTINSKTNNIFTSVPMEMEINNEYQNSSNIYESLLTKELLKYHLSNLFNILKSKIIIIKSKIFPLLKNISNSKINNLVEAEILYLKISSNLNLISSIFKKNRINILYQTFHTLKTKLYFVNNKGNVNNNTFRNKYETKYKKEKNDAINENNNSIKKLEKDIKDIEKNIKILTKKEFELKTEINNCYKKEKQLNDKIKNFENSNNNMKKSIDMKKQHSSNISSIPSNYKYDSDIYTLESTIESNKQLKEGKEEIIKVFMKKVNDLLTEYQIYIDSLNSIENGTNNDNNGNNYMNIEFNDNSNSNQQSSTHKEESTNSWNKNPKKNQQNSNNYNYQNNININDNNNGI